MNAAMLKRGQYSKYHNVDEYYGRGKKVSAHQVFIMSAWNNFKPLLELL